MRSGTLYGEAVIDQGSTRADVSNALLAACASAMAQDLDAIALYDRIKIETEVLREDEMTFMGTTVRTTRVLTVEIPVVYDD